MSAQAESAAKIEPATRSLRRAWTAHATQWLEREGLVVLVVSAYAITMLVRIDRQLFSDGWLALLAGRNIVAHGLPTHDSLTVWTQDRRWIDQQWLGQLALYGLSRVGGLRLALLTHIAFGVGAYAGALAIARRLGASSRAVAWLALAALPACYVSSANMRTQSFAYPLFVAVVWLLACDSRSPSRRVFLVLPLLALWANLHGSVVLGAGLVALHGLATATTRARKEPASTWRRRTAALVVLPCACLFASPYALDLPQYYREIVLNRAFGQYVSEWAPTTLTLFSASFFVVAAVTIWTLGRLGERLTLFEKAALGSTMVLSFLAIRNVVWFVLAALVILPPVLTALLEERSTGSTRRLNRTLGAAAIAASSLILVVALAHRDSWFSRSYPPNASAAILAAAGPGGRVFANEAYSDWLMWQRPELEGRIAWDARFELLTGRQLKSVGEFRGRVEGWRSLTRGFQVVVLDADAERKQAAELLAAHDAYVVYRDRSIVAIGRRT
jgi:hypothetical protein